MANTQITPFQLTDQFTMDNFNQRINETNTALQKKADGGYGFGGETLLSISVSDASESYESFCAKVDAVLATMRDGSVKMIRAYPPEIYGYGTPTCILYKHSNDYAGLYSVSSYNEAPFGFRMIKCKIDSSDPTGKWQPFEWVNPPMTLGVEYRTTERYQGKPVYVKALNFGALPNNTMKDISLGYADGVIMPLSVEGHFYSGPDRHSIPWEYSGKSVKFANFNPNSVAIVTNYNLSGFENCHVVIKFTKDTD